MTITHAIESAFEKNGIDLNPREIVTALKRAGYAIVPRVATPAMIVEAMITAYPTVSEAGGMLEQAREAARLEWAAMVAAAENGT